MMKINKPKSTQHCRVVVVACRVGKIARACWRVETRIAKNIQLMKCLILEMVMR
jgi:hypothetical protein